MKIGFVVNKVADEDPGYTTIRLALSASRRGHDVWLIDVAGFSHEPGGSVKALARSAPGKKYRTEKAYLDKVQGDEGVVERIELDDLDVLMLRNDPAEDAVDRPWAVASGILFAQLAVARGVLVVNDPSSLASAVNKTYFQHFPEQIRPRTLVTRDEDAIKDFVDELDGTAVLKPLQGSGGAGVFLVSADESPNLNQMIEALSRDGYIVVQEYLEEAEKGDVRLFVMNGQPLEHEGKVAVFRRKNPTADMRSNMHAGGKAHAVRYTEEMAKLVELVRPKLLTDGMFFVGLDMVGSKLMEVNVFSPGGLGSCQRLYDTDFTQPVIDALERKADLRDSSPELSNTQLASL